MLEDINKPDLNAPRYRVNRVTLLNKEFYDSFYKKYPEYKDQDMSTIKEIVKTFNKELAQTIINERDGVEFPEGLGYSFIGTCKPTKRKNINFQVSHEYRKKLEHRNFESDRYIAKIFYSNYASKYKYKNRELWQFKADRAFTRAVSKTYPENWKQYVQVESFKMINTLYKSRIKKEYFIKKDIHDCKEYNEFELD